MRRLISFAAALAATTTLLPTTASAARAIPDDSAHLAAPIAADHRPEPLRLDCAARVSDGIAGARCAWSTPTSAAAVGVTLLRVAIGSADGREVVFRTNDLDVTEHVDATIRTGVRYAYAIVAVNDAGRIVGRSRAVVVGVATTDPPSVDVLRLDCAASPNQPDGRRRIGCQWTVPEVPARQLTLWRSVDGAVRERVASFAAPFDASYRDVVPAGTDTVAYAVIATDGAGDIVARSRAEHVELVTVPATIRPAPPTTVRPRVTTTAPSRLELDAPTRPTTTVPPSPTSQPAAAPLPTTIPRATSTVPDVPVTTLTPSPGRSEPADAAEAGRDVRPVDGRAVQTRTEPERGAAD